MSLFSDDPELNHSLIEEKLGFPYGSDEYFKRLGLHAQRLFQEEPSLLREQTLRNKRANDPNIYLLLRSAIAFSNLILKDKELGGVFEALEQFAEIAENDSPCSLNEKEKEAQDYVLGKLKESSLREGASHTMEKLGWLVAKHAAKNDKAFFNKLNQAVDTFHTPEQQTGDLANLILKAYSALSMKYYGGVSGNFTGLISKAHLQEEVLGPRPIKSSRRGGNDETTQYGHRLKDFKKDLKRLGLDKIPDGIQEEENRK